MKELFFEITFALVVIAVLGAGGNDTTEPLDQYVPEFAATPLATQQAVELLDPASSAERRVDFVPLGALPLHPMVTG